MAFSQRLTIAQAAALGLPFIEIALTNWGNVGATADTYSLSFPLPSSVAAIAIAPRSEVDRCIVRFTPGVRIINTSPVIPSDQIRADEFVISTDAPYLCSTPGPITIRAHETSWFSDTYIKNGAVVTSTFGGANNQFKLPTLRLLLYFTPPISSPKRVAYNFPDRADTANFPPTITMAGLGAETLIGILPATGRGHVQVSFRPTTTAVASFRVGAIDVGAFFGGTNITMERTVATMTGIDANTGQVAEYANGITAQYLALYYTLTAGAGDLNYFVRMTDCCDGRAYVTPAAVEA